MNPRDIAGERKKKKKKKKKYIYIYIYIYIYTDIQTKPDTDTEKQTKKICWLVGCLTSQQQANVSQGRICSDKVTCYHSEIEIADQTFYLTQSQ